MRLQVVLTPTEAEKLIAKATIQVDVVQKALKNGIVAIHPCSTTYFLIEELLGKIPSHPWVFGVIAPKGTCRNRELIEHVQTRSVEELKDPLGHTWILEKGELGKRRVLRALLNEMGPEDVFIKGANALDPEGNVGILVARTDGGTVGNVVSYGMAKGINLVFPVGIEKLIPVPIRRAVLEAGIQKMNYSVGAPVGLIPAFGTVITEMWAIRILTGAEAISIASGGLEGAEGGTTLVIKGDEGQVGKAVALTKQIKGAKLPKINLVECSKCKFPEVYSACTEKTRTWKSAKE